MQLLPASTILRDSVHWLWDALFLAGLAVFWMLACSLLIASDKFLSKKIFKREKPLASETAYQLLSGLLTLAVGWWAWNYFDWKI